MPRGIFPRKPHSEETKRKISESKKKLRLPKNGIVKLSYWDNEAIAVCSKCGKKRKVTATYAYKVVAGAYRNVCPNCGQRGKKSNPPEYIKHLRENMFGGDNPNWRGGKARLKDHIRALAKYREWRLEVFRKDKFACQCCGDSKGHNLQADHIKSFSSILEKNGVESTRQAVECDELWDISNGRTLCLKCHKLTDNYGTKKKSIYSRD